MRTHTIFWAGHRACEFAQCKPFAIDVAARRRHFAPNWIESRGTWLVIRLAANRPVDAKWVYFIIEFPLSIFHNFILRSEYISSQNRPSVRPTRPSNQFQIESHFAIIIIIFASPCIRALQDNFQLRSENDLLFAPLSLSVRRPMPTPTPVWQKQREK